MDFSFVILSFNSEKYIQTCLESVVEACSSLGADYEIFVIDNGSQDQSRALIEQVRVEKQANINLIPFDHNTGTTFSRNQGLAKSSGDHIVILDSDAYVNAEALKHLAELLTSQPRYGLVCPKLTYPDGRFQLSTDVFPTFVRKLQRFLFLKKMEAEVKVPDSLEIVDYAISAFWMFPRKVLNEVGLLDEKIFYSPEDVDFCIRVWKAGYQIAYDPSVSVVHDAQEISRSKGFKLNVFTFSHAKGLFYLFFKHRYFFSGQKFRAGIS